MEQLQKAMLQAAAQQNITLIVLIFAAATAQEDVDTMQHIVNDYAHNFNTQMQEDMRKELAGVVEQQQRRERFVAYLEQHLPMHTLKRAAESTSEASLQQAQTLINKAMLH